MVWNETTTAALRRLWEQTSPQLSTAEIGRLLGCSKNATVGRAHRLDLPSRPSPIKRPEGWTPAEKKGPAAAPVPRKPALTLTPLQSAQIWVVPPKPEPIEVKPLVCHLAVRLEEKRRAEIRQRRSRPCCWPIGEPGSKAFRFCDDESASPKPYCLTHAKIAYISVRDRKEDAAVT